jgi:hypothetical protein
MNELPEWIATLIGRLVIENEALRRALAEAAQAAPAQPGSETPPDDAPPD